MTKEEMKNRISMALKDPVLQQGFECICKENAELEKEKADFEKAYNEAEELLDKQIEATIKLLNDFNRAKDLIKNIIRVTWGEGWNYSLQVKVEAEKFLKESEE